MPRNPNRQRCTAHTLTGKQCKAWAIAQSNPPLCSAHANRNTGAGAPTGNDNALKHGFYSRTFSFQELADLLTAQPPNLTDEIIVSRIALRRLMEAVSDPNMNPTMEQFASVCDLVFTGSRTVARLLRDQRALSGAAADGIAGAIAQALDELATELGIAL